MYFGGLLFLGGTPLALDACRKHKAKLVIAKLVAQPPPFVAASVA